MKKDAVDYPDFTPIILTCVYIFEMLLNNKKYCGYKTCLRHNSKVGYIIM